MSHISNISTEGLGFDLETIKGLCERQGWEFLDQKTFVWFENDKGICDYAIRIPGCRYELGLIRGEIDYTVQADFWDSGGLAQVLGDHGEAFKQLYLQTSDIMWAESKNYQWEDAPSEIAGARKLVMYVPDDFGGGDW